MFVGDFANLIGELDKLSKASDEKIKASDEKIKALETEIKALKTDSAIMENRIIGQYRNIKGQGERIKDQGERIEALETENGFVTEALEVLLPREAYLLAAQVLLIKLGLQPQVKNTARHCQNAYHSVGPGGNKYGEPFVAMIQAEFRDEMSPDIFSDMDNILNARNAHANTLPVQEVLRQSKKIVSYMTHRQDHWSRRDLLVLKILQRAENLLDDAKHRCCVPPRR